MADDLPESSLGLSVVRVVFVFCCVVTGIFVWLTREAASGDAKSAAGSDFKKFQRLYLIVYLLAMFSDWLQGPYVYALYESYGFTPGENATLFVAGFGSSMIFGTVVGAMADSTGRKRAALLYCLLYITSCMTKHVSSYLVLMIGRITGGMATSLLMSVFESWLVCEHNSRGFAPELLGETFGLAIFGNSVVAIVAGLVAEFAADALPLRPKPGPSPHVHLGGYCSPFDVSILCLLACGTAAHLLWTENYGEQKPAGAGSQLAGLRDAGAAILSNKKVLCCGAVCSLFEASMFIFVFQWTPAVSEPKAQRPPYGLMFATFMVACMLGSRIFSYAIKKVRVERIGQGLLVLAFCAHLVPVVSSYAPATFCGFLVFELCVGIYFPMMGTMKSRIVPEASRSTIYNLYRVPLNFAVVTALLVKLSVTSAFTVTSLLLVVAFLAQTLLASIGIGDPEAAARASSHGGEEGSQVEIVPVIVGAGTFEIGEEEEEEEELEEQLEA